MVGLPVPVAAIQQTIQGVYELLKNLIFEALQEYTYWLKTNPIEQKHHL